jgi:hypothetical protein
MPRKSNDRSLAPALPILGRLPVASQLVFDFANDLLQLRGAEQSRRPGRPGKDMVNAASDQCTREPGRRIGCASPARQAGDTAAAYRF